MSGERCVLALDQMRNVAGGSPEALHAAVRRGADLRIYTEFRHGEHVDTTSDHMELVREVSDFPAAYLIDGRWVSAVMTLRQPVTLPDRFGERASMSFFLYNEDGSQAIARPYLDSRGYLETLGEPEPLFSTGVEEKPMKYMHVLDEFSAGENAVGSNFIYDFYAYRFLAQDDWTEIYSHDAEGNVFSGSPDALDEASSNGRDLKVAISGICCSRSPGEPLPAHELYIQTGPHYYYSETRLMVAETRPFVRIRPAVPMVYTSDNWDFGWAIVRSD